MEETTLELVKQWLIKANNDLQVIENELNSAEIGRASCRERV